MPEMHLISTDLPAPLSPHRAVDVSGRQVEVDVGQRLDGAEALVEAPHLQKGLVPARLGHLVTFVVHTRLRHGPVGRGTVAARGDDGPARHVWILLVTA